MAHFCLKSVIPSFGLAGSALLASAVSGCAAPLSQLAEQKITVDQHVDVPDSQVGSVDQPSARPTLPHRPIRPQLVSVPDPELSLVQAGSAEPKRPAFSDPNPQPSSRENDERDTDERDTDERDTDERDTDERDTDERDTGGVGRPLVKVSRSIVDESSAAAAAQSETATWNLQELQRLALQHNPAIRQAAAAANEADGVHNQTGLRPNPTVSYVADEIGNEGQAGLHGIQVSQTIVRGRKLAWNQQVVGHEVQIRRWNEKAQRQRALTDVRLHFVSALAAQLRLQLTREFREVAEQGVRISEQRVQAKFAGRADVLQSEMQLSQVDLAIQQAKLDLDAAWQLLAAVIGQPELDRRPLEGELEPHERSTDPDELLPQLLSDNPLLASAQYRVSRARANLERQQVQKIPNLTAQLGTGHDDATGNAFASLQLSIPVPVHNRNQGNVHAAWAEYCQATQNVRRVKMQIRRDLAVQLRDYQSAQAAVKQYRDVIVPRAKETLDLMKMAQAGGEYDFLRVLTARRAFYDASISYVAAARKMAIAEATIDGQLLTGGLSGPVDTPLSTGLRGQALSQQ